MSELKRLVIDLRSGEFAIRCLYSTKDGPGPNTKARARQVSNLVRPGLEQALEALEGGRVDIVGTSGYTTREDVLCIAVEGAPEILHKKLKNGA